MTSPKKITSFTPVLYIRIVLDSFYLLIFYSEKFSTWIWRLPFSVNVNLNLAICYLFKTLKLFFASVEFQKYCSNIFISELRLYLCIETVVCRLLQQMLWMEMIETGKSWATFSSFNRSSLRIHQKKLYYGYCSLIQFVWYFLLSSIGAFCARVN